MVTLREYHLWGLFSNKVKTYQDGDVLKIWEFPLAKSREASKHIMTVAKIVSPSTVHTVTAKMNERKAKWIDVTRRAEELKEKKINKIPVEDYANVALWRILGFSKRLDYEKDK